jgi:acetate kinase
MNILVANLGSTSFKYRLFRFDGSQAAAVAKGGYERVTDYGKAIDDCLAALKAEGKLRSGSDLDAVAFKTVLGGALTGCVEADEGVEKALLDSADLAPAHNPPYAAGIRRFREKLPAVRRVALFETAFYQWLPERTHRYAVPETWYKAGVRRHGFHGASHKFSAERAAELLDRPDVAEITRALYQAGPRPVSGAPLRIISCHLGGSSSVTATMDGVAIGTSMGFSPQSGLPQNNRVGDLDSAAIPFIHRKLGLSLAEIERQLTKESGLLALSGVGNDMRDIRAAAKAGDRRAEIAVEAFVQSVRHWVGAFWFEMGGCDALVFSGGIGEHDVHVREAVCAGLPRMGLILDQRRNDVSPVETDLTCCDSTTKVFVIPANEELVVAREARRLLLAKPSPPSLVPQPGL